MLAGESEGADGTHEQPAESPPATDQTGTKLQIGLEAVRWTGRIISIAAFAIPVTALLPIVEVLAGRKTEVSFIVAISVGATIAISIAVTYNVTKFVMARGKELNRLRRRISDLEDQLRSKE